MAGVFASPVAQFGNALIRLMAASTASGLNTLDRFTPIAIASLIRLTVRQTRPGSYKATNWPLGQLKGGFGYKKI